MPESYAITIRQDVPLDRACFVGCGAMTGVGTAINTIHSGQDEPLRAVLDLIQGRGVDFAFEAISTPKTIELAFRMTARGGVCTIVGVSPEGARISLTPNVFTLMEKTLEGSFYGSTRPRVNMLRRLDMYI